MCFHFNPVLEPRRLSQHFKVTGVDLGTKSGIYPGYVAPFIRKHEIADTEDETLSFRELMTGSFGMIPHWAKDANIARRTYKAKIETIHEKPSFKDAWRLGRYCIIPADAIFEPDWRTGRGLQTKIVRKDQKPMGIAGIWTSWIQPDRSILRSFAMLTVNADGHEFMRWYQKPGDEKRMIVILQEEDYDTWLSASPNENRKLLRQFPAENMDVFSSE